MLPHRLKRLAGRALRHVHREFIVRRLPHGLLGWRYLWVRRRPELQIHRMLWWNAPRRLPRPVWLMGELCLWLRWVGFDAWRANWHCLRFFGPEVRSREGLALSLQAWRTLRLSLAWCIRPQDAYRYRLYRDPGVALDFVFDHELIAYHRWRSAPLGLQQESLALLQDKLRLAERLAAVGIPMVPTLARVPRGACPDLGRWLQGEKALFCKTASGHAGIGAFAVWETPAGLQGRSHDGTELRSPEEVQAAWRALLRRDDALVQPRQVNHPDLQPLTECDGVVNVRFISRWCGEKLACLSAMLEVPSSSQKGERIFVFLPIDRDSGRLHPSPESLLLSGDVRRSVEQIARRLETVSMVPGWQELTEMTFRAHELFPDVWAIAWDWVVTPEGPRLLEGNSGWGASRVQMVNGGLLAARNACGQDPEVGPGRPAPVHAGLPASSR